MILWIYLVNESKIATRDGGLREKKMISNIWQGRLGRKFVENLGLKIPALYHESDTVEEIPCFTELIPEICHKTVFGMVRKNVFVMVNGENQLDEKLVQRQLNNSHSKSAEY